MIEYTCTECGAAMASPKSLEGQSETCPTCGRAVLVPVELPAGLASSGGDSFEADGGDSFDPMDILSTEEPVRAQQPKGRIHCMCPACGENRKVEPVELGDAVACPACGKTWTLPDLSARHECHMRLEGIARMNEDGISRQKILRFCRDGESLLLRVDRDGIRDGQIVTVETLTPECIGHLAKEQSAELAGKLAAGQPYEAILAHRSTTNNRIRTVDLEIAHYA